MLPSLDRMLRSLPPSLHVTALHPPLRRIVLPTVTVHTGGSTRRREPALGAGHRTDARVRPGVCPTCGTQPYPCPTDGAYQCRCPNPFLIKLPKKSRPKIIPRVHYTREGEPDLTPRFIDGYTDLAYPNHAEDAAWAGQ